MSEETLAFGRSLPYRPDIDGLRAISVLAVIFFHAKLPGFAGGYVGVDVFFVISGYLITQVLMPASDRGSLGKLRSFYVRRCRRLLPALIVMLLASTLAAYWLFLPSDLRRFGTQLTFTSVFLGNLAIWRDGGYFDVQSPFKPLLHLWSLAVEEQFYLVFPVIMLVSGGSLRHRRRALLAGAALASFGLCVWASYRWPNANFFLAPTRAWELLLGSLVALGVGRSLSTHYARDTLAGASLLAILACIVGYNDGMRYPGLYAVVPCVGAAVLIATASGPASSRVGRWMSVKPVVFTGLISYSLYLWHIPVLAFAGYYNVRALEAWQLSILLPVIYLLSVASWRCIEAPVRSRAALSSDSRFLPAVGGATMVIALLGLILAQSGGLPGRLNEADAQLIDGIDLLQIDARDCAARSLSAVATGSLCRYGPSAGASAVANVVVWGDSHAVVLLPEYERIAKTRNLRIYVAVHSSCRPLLDAASKNDIPARRLACRDFNRAAVKAIEKINPDLVIFNAFWAYPDLEIEATAGSDPTQGVPPFQLGFERTLDAIGAERRKICVVGDVPKLDYVMPYSFAMARRRNIDTTFIEPRPSEAQLQVDEHFAQLKRRHDLTFVDPKTALCTGPTCAVVTADGKSIYRDDNHLTTAGARLVGRSLEACFGGIR